MCLAVPASVVEILSSDTALVEITGLKKKVNISLIPQVKKGDFVIIHVGYALSIMNLDEARKTLQLFEGLKSHEIY